MHGRRTGIGNITKLPGVMGGQKDGGKQDDYKDCAQDRCRQLLQGAHCALRAKARPARSANAFAASITKQTTSVTLTIRGKSRLSAACQASCPRPGESHRASMGTAAPKAIAKDTPNRARSAGAATGRTCRQKIAPLRKPLARAASTW